MADNTDHSPPNFSIRFTPRANGDAIDAALYLSSVTGNPEWARRWYIELRSIAGTLATNPARNRILSRESRLLGLTLRRLLYRRRPGGVAYHLYYASEEGGIDGPRVVIIDIRHASRRPLTPKETKALRSELP